MTEEGVYLRAARALLDLSQEQLAELASVSVASVKRIEKGVRGTPVIVNALHAALSAEGIIISNDLSSLADLEIEAVIAKVRR